MKAKEQEEVREREREERREKKILYPVSWPKLTAIDDFLLYVLLVFPS